MNRNLIVVLVALTIALLFFLNGRVTFIDRTTTALYGKSYSRRDVHSNSTTTTSTCFTTSDAANTDQATTTPAAPLLLRDINIVMIGDSLMRYQYLSLAYRLRYGAWFNHSTSYYNLVDERSFQDPYHGNTWGAFLLHTNRLLYPYEVCDCRRLELKQDWKPTLLENRYYYDPILNNSVVFLFASGHEHPLRGRLQAPSIKVMQTNRKWQMSAFLDYKTVAWEYSDWSDIIRHHVSHLDPPPRHIIMNAAFWPHRFGWAPSSTPHQKRIKSREHYSNDTNNLFQVIQEYPQFQFVWKTTTFSVRRVNSGQQTDDIMCAHFPTCLNMTFTSVIQRKFYWDRVHFLEPIYRVTNEEMLGMFGYLPHDYRRVNLSDILE